MTALFIIFIYTFYLTFTVALVMLGMKGLEILGNFLWPD